ncbi:MAG: prepilin-type N-terminal cleavage/methylation domain-containing protein [Candidatus Solibacter usitatus]|nr:prepilin-type N-terminal cleavage/methylation domain-containing protein [Candidatus Solibacter usitatus]
MRESRREFGVTLLELLIAMTLLALLSTGVLMAMRVGFGALQKTNKTFLANRRAFGAQRILEQQIAGFIPVSAACNAAGGPPPYTRVSFFQGELQTMRFASTYSLAAASRGMATILELQVIPGEEGRGYRLIVNEHPYTGPLGAGRFCTGTAPDPFTGTSATRFIPVGIREDSFVLADKLAECRFLYRVAMPEPPFERWVPRWVYGTYPTAIRIEMTPLETSASKWTAVSTTFPVFVNREPLGDYSE